MNAAGAGGHEPAEALMMFDRSWLLPLLMIAGCSDDANPSTCPPCVEQVFAIVSPIGVPLSDVHLMGADCKGAAIHCMSSPDDAPRCSFIRVAPPLSDASDYVCFIVVTYPNDPPFTTTIRWHKSRNACCSTYSFDHSNSAVEIPDHVVDMSGTPDLQ